MDSGLTPEVFNFNNRLNPNKPKHNSNTFNPANQPNLRHHLVILVRILDTDEIVTVKASAIQLLKERLMPDGSKLAGVWDRRSMGCVRGLGVLRVLLVIGALGH